MFWVVVWASAKQVLVDEDDPGLGRVQIRVGFHSGPVVATVVGKKNPRFCLCAPPPSYYVAFNCSIYRSCGERERG